MDLPTRFILETRAWADEMSRKDPGFFPRMAEGQQPGIFWIGCADSRVPAELITHAAPGELFVHRSIANMALNDDVSLMSALQYALQALKVDDVIVCGHERCGGIRAALLPPADIGDDGGDEPSYLAARIRPLRALYQRHRQEVNAAALEEPLDSEPGMLQRVNRLVTLNVSEQVRALAATELVQQVWREGRPLRLHGWVYGLETGYLNRVLSVDGPSMQQAEAA
jgi:carbonic anhydrase